MKKNTYKYGTTRCQAYLKSAGHGYEVGFHFGKDRIFVGNFINKAEATKWYTQMNKHVKTFTTRYWAGKTVPKTWYKKFLSNHLFKAYYSFVNKEISKNDKKFTRTLKGDIKKYQQIKRTKKWKPREKVTLRRAA